LRRRAVDVTWKNNADGDWSWRRTGSRPPDSTTDMVIKTASALIAAALSPVYLSASEPIFCGPGSSFFAYDDQSGITQRASHGHRGNGGNFHICSIGRIVRSAARKRLLK
jgi:hypothetical protein